MTRKLNRTLIAVSLSASLFTSSAATLEEAKTLYMQGNYTEALAAFQELYKSPKNAKNASINQWLGVCLYETGQHKESRKYFEFASTKNVAESNRYLSKLEFEEYNFDEAQSYIDTYAKALSRQKKELSNEARADMARIRSAKSMIEHVEKIVVIDSLTVDKDNFFSYYKISPSVGSFTTSDNLPYEKPQNPTFVFATENSEKMLWVEQDSSNVSKLMETTRLIDGSWEPYTKADDILNNNGDMAYPFMMPDGSTLYYASDGDGSIGGLDIYMSRKNLEDGSYYQPQNIGMPYNSTFDDYLLVIDENTGVGWWATDRNQIPGKVTIYMFIPNEVRTNYDSTDENICSYAKINCIKDTWEDGADYSSYFEKIESIGKDTEKKQKDFEFEVKNGIVYTTYDDAKTSEGRQFLEQYISTQNSYNSNVEQLKQLRKQYAESSNSERARLKGKITSLEKSLLKKAEELKYLKNSAIKAELKSLNLK